MDDTIITPAAYHGRTVHRFDRYADGPDGLDWEAQPDPFRRYAGAETIALPFSANELMTASWGSLYGSRGITPAMLTVKSVAALLQASLGLSAIKSFGDNRWALRMNPSSGNLHPTEAYVVAGDLPGLPGGVYHYAPAAHALERRMTSPDGAFPGKCFGRVYVALASIHEREEWKYGERAFRYCQHDVGHAVAALRYAAALLGWQVKLMADVADEAVGRLIGVDRPHDAEPEAPDLLLQIEPGTGHMAKIGVDQVEAMVVAAVAGRWDGVPNRISSGPKGRWPVVAQVSRATAKPVTGDEPWTPPPSRATVPSDVDEPGVAVIARRRSAQRFDGVTPLAAKKFFRMLDTTFPRQKMAPFEALPWAPKLHLLLFVHNVAGVTPGLYALPRSDRGEAELREAVKESFVWAKSEGAPDHLPLYLLQEGDARQVAMTVSCHQDIAGSSAFSLGMAADLACQLSLGPWWYRRLFWEAGMIGHVLYLEAEAAGVRGTGIGCYFDEAVAELFFGGVETGWRTLYHFTVGTPVEDPRLTTELPYGG